MTANQLRYWELQETKRSNKRKEDETERSNLAREQETARHNQEIARHNKATETIDAFDTGAKVLKGATPLITAFI